MIEKRQVDWEKEFGDWGLTCPFCEGEYEKEDGEYCEHCENGYVETYWNTVWGLGRPYQDDIGKKEQKMIEEETGCLLLYNCEEGKWYLTLGGCGMDLSPALALAFALIDTWIPEEILESLHTDWNYIKYVVGEKGAKRLVREVIKSSGLYKAHRDNQLKKFKQIAEEQKIEIKEKQNVY